MKSGYINIQGINTIQFRIDPTYHLNDCVKVRKLLDASPYSITEVGKSSGHIFLGNIFTRLYVKDEEHGVPYLSPSDTLLSNLNTGVFLSKKQAEKLSYLMLKKDWITITCSGTVGNVVYTNKNYEKCIASHDLIRIVPDDNKMLGGCLFAYLSGRIGNVYLTRSEYGGVVKHINDEHVSSIPIPVFPDAFQKKIDDKIKKSAKLREEANDALEKAHKIIEELIDYKSGKVSHKTSIKTIMSSHNTRLEAAYYSSENRRIYEFVISKFKCERLKTYSDDIFRPGIFKRYYVKNGVTFLGGADILLAIPKSNKQLSFSQVEKMPELNIKEDWILVTCGGTIGNTVLVDSHLAKCTVSQHVLRIIPNESVNKGYLYAFLSSTIGKKLITLFTYGSVIPQIEPHHLSLVPIPCFSNDVKKKIGDLIDIYKSKNCQAKELELSAISEVESEIESWEKCKIH